MEGQTTKVSTEQRQAQDQRLLGRMTARDEAALSEFYDEYAGLVYGLALRVVGSAADAEDVVVDVFWQVWQQAGRYDAERGKVVTWLMTLARSRAIDRRRRIRRKETIAQAIDAPSQGVAEPVVDPVEDALTAERRQRVRAALDSLPDSQRRAIELAYFAGMTQSEIAAALDQPLGTVKTRIRAGLAQLRESLRPYM